MLLRNANVEHALRVLLGELVQPGRPEHRRGDTHQSRVPISECDDLVGEHRRPRGLARGVDGLAGFRIDLPDRVELVCRVGESRLVAATLFRDRMHDDRSAVVLRLLQFLGEGFYVVTIDRPEILDIEVGVQRLIVRQSRQEPVGSAADAAVEGTTRCPELVKRRPRCRVQVAVGAPGANVVEEVRHATDGGSIRAAVVVDDDDEVATVVVTDVVESFPGHATRESAITHDGNDVTV